MLVWLAILKVSKSFRTARVIGIIFLIGLAIGKGVGRWQTQQNLDVPLLVFLTYLQRGGSKTEVGYFVENDQFFPTILSSAADSTFFVESVLGLHNI